MNIALPRSSLALAAKLSSQHIYLEVCIRAFYDTQKLPTPALKLLQSQLLQCRFFTWPFFRKYAQKAYDAFSLQQKEAWGERGLETPHPSCLDDLWPNQIICLEYLGFPDRFFIPENLLRGPWTADNASLLYTLVCLHGEIDWEGSVAGETAKEGLFDAIRQTSERAVAALAVLLGIAKALSTEYVRTAAIDYKCNKNIVRQLLFNAQILSTMDFHDPALWGWAERAEKSGDLNGPWLRERLKKAETFSLSWYERGETWKTVGGLVPFPYSGPKFNPTVVLHQSPIAQELLAKLYRQYGRRITTGRSRTDTSQISTTGVQSSGE